MFEAFLSMFEYFKGVFKFFTTNSFSKPRSTTQKLQRHRAILYADHSSTIALITRNRTRLQLRGPRGSFEDGPDAALAGVSTQITNTRNCFKSTGMTFSMRNHTRTHHTFISHVTKHLTC